MKRSPAQFAYSVVLPTFHEAANLRRLLPQLGGFFAQMARPYEIVVVDDDSQDGTSELVKKLQRQGVKIRLIVRQQTRGLASALLAGTEQAAHPHVIRMDADLAHRVEDLHTLLQAYEVQRQPTVVIGSRFVEGSHYKGKPWLNRVFSWGGRKLSQFMLRLPVADTSNNFRIFPRDRWLAFREQLVSDGNVLLVQELLLFHHQKTSFLEVPITYVERQLGHSKLRLLPEAQRFIKTLPRLLMYANQSSSQT